MVIKIDFALMSISGIDNKSWIISEFPFSAAIYKGVLFQSLKQNFIKKASIENFIQKNLIFEKFYQNENQFEITLAKTILILKHH